MISLSLPLCSATTRCFQICADDPGHDAFALNDFVGIERILVAVAVGEDDIVAFVKPFRVQIVGELGFALFEVAAVTVNFGFDNIPVPLVEDKNIGASASAGYFDQGVAAQSLQKEIEKAIE